MPDQRQFKRRALSNMMRERSPGSSSICASSFACPSFLHVLAGTTADYEAIAASDGATVPELASLVPDTQLCMQSQYADAKMQQTHASPLFKIRTFPSAKLSRYVVNRAYKFLLLEVRPFWDGYDKSVGISWIDVFGESAQEDDAAFHAALARSPSAQGENSQPVDLSAWAKDADGDASMETPKGLAAFKPTGEAARLLAAEQRNAPPKPPRNLAAEQARPILSRNETALKDLRGGAETGAAAASARPPPSCSQHPTAMMVQRIDRKSDPPRPFYVCLHKSATGQPCDTKIYA
jgi:hypothetical protein